MMEEQQVINAAAILEEHSGERTRCEVYSRIVGYLRPVSQWNPGKKEEFKDRATYDKSRADCIQC
jgi:ribonucleoside-triphosphate reductase